MQPPSKSLDQIKTALGGGVLKKSLQNEAPKIIIVAHKAEKSHGFTAPHTNLQLTVRNHGIFTIYVKTKKQL